MMTLEVTMIHDSTPDSEAPKPLAAVLIALEGTEPERTAEWLDTATEINARQLEGGVVECDVTIDGKALRYTSTDEGETWSDGAPIVVPDMSAWDEFRAASMLWWVNRILHTFGWSIVVGVDDDTGKVVHAWPARTDWLGFSDEVNERRLAQFRKGLGR